MIQDDLDNQENVIKALNSGIGELLARGDDSSSKHSPLLRKQSEMNELWKSVNSMLKDKRNQLQERLTGVRLACNAIPDWTGA